MSEKNPGVVLMPGFFSLSVRKSYAGARQNGSDVLKNYYHPMPSLTKEVVFVKGSWYQMGVQYGKQAAEAVEAKIASGMASTLDFYGSRERAGEEIGKYCDLLEERAPQIKRFWEGISAGVNRKFLDIALAYTDLRTAGTRCSNISAWGDAAVDQEVYCGMNCDEKELVNHYAPTVVAFPIDGYPFISASGFTCNCVMNNQGLVLMASCGENALQEDTGAGLPNCVSLALCAASCKSAEEAKQKIIKEKLGPGGGENIHIVDRRGNAYIIEHTAAREEVRVSGSYGEENYLLATNHFVSNRMQRSNFSGKEHQFWMNSYFRYWSEQQILREHYGQIDLKTLNETLGCQSFFAEDIKLLQEKGWEVPEQIKPGWNRADVDTLWQTGKFSPEICCADGKCVFSSLMIPRKLYFYILDGCRDRILSMKPWATGVFSKIVLADEIRKVTDCIQEEAKERIYRISCRNGFTSSLNDAKLAYMNGSYWKDRAICEEDEEERLHWWSLSASLFLRAQQYAFLDCEEVGIE